MVAPQVILPLVNATAPTTSVTLHGTSLQVDEVEPSSSADQIDKRKESGEETKSSLAKKSVTSQKFELLNASLASEDDDRGTDYVSDHESAAEVLCIHIMRQVWDVHCQTSKVRREAVRPSSKSSTHLLKLRFYRAPLFVTMSRHGSQDHALSDQLESNRGGPEPIGKKATALNLYPLAASPQDLWKTHGHS